MGTLFSKKEIKLIVVGLDNSGKSTMIRALKPQKNVTQEGTTPTVGFSRKINKIYYNSQKMISLLP